MFLKYKEAIVSRQLKVNIKKFKVIVVQKKKYSRAKLIHVPTAVRRRCQI